MKKYSLYLLPAFIGCFVLIMLLSLHFGILQVFFFGAEHADVQGIDYFAVPKSFLNLVEQRSIYDTWGGTAYGPHATWYLAHPAFSVFVASWFSFFSPWTSYWLFSIFSLGIMGVCGYLISKRTPDLLNKQLSFFFLLCAFPTYWMLYVGNMHAPLVLSITLILTGIFELTYGTSTKKANTILFAGLLISFFTKPIVLLMLPLLLIIKETRATTLKSIFIYGFISLAFIFVPLLNPDAVGWEKLTSIDFRYIQEHMNIYKNNFVLNAFMKDNSIHWTNLIAQSDYKLIHIDVFSLPVFVDVLLGKETEAWIFKLPIYICLALSIAIAFIADKKIRLECTLLLIMAISLTFFLSYNTVWEYQFTSALPLIAFLPILKKKQVFYEKYIRTMTITGLFFCLPSLYFLFRNSDLSNSTTFTWIHADKVIPSFILFAIMIWQLLVVVKKHAVFKPKS
jgi:hypothetical protein